MSINFKARAEQLGRLLEYTIWDPRETSLIREMKLAYEMEKPQEWGSKNFHRLSEVAALLLKAGHYVPKANV